MDPTYLKDPTDPKDLMDPLNSPLSDPLNSPKDLMDPSTSDLLDLMDPTVPTDPTGASPRT